MDYRLPTQYGERVQKKLRAAFDEEYPPHETGVGVSFALGLFLTAVPNMGVSVLLLGNLILAVVLAVLGYLLAVSGVCGEALRQLELRERGLILFDRRRSIPPGGEVLGEGVARPMLCVNFFRIDGRDERTQLFEIAVIRQRKADVKFPSVPKRGIDRPAGKASRQRVGLFDQVFDPVEATCRHRQDERVTSTEFSPGVVSRCGKVHVEVALDRLVYRVCKL